MSGSRNPFDPVKYPFCFSGHNYALDVISGKIPNAKFIIGACKRYLKDLDKKEYPFDADKAEKYLRVVQKFNHVSAIWKTKNITFEPWQNFVFMNIFGFINPNTGFRRFRVAHLEVSRGNGKSLLASQALLYLLSLDDPKGNFISCFATKADQARLVLDSSRAMAKENRSFLKNTGTKVLAHKIVHEKSNSVARAMSSEDKGLDGLNDILSIIDELHSITAELFDVVSSGMSKRSDSLMLCISTSGFDLESVGYSQSTYAKKVAMGEVEDDQFFSAVYTIDEGDDIYSEITWRKANPGYGISVDPISFAAKAKKTLDVPRDLPNFKVKHLNTWLSEANAYYEQAKWDLCAQPDLKLEDFKGQKCKMGVDLASKIDLCSLGYIFYKEGIYYLFDRSYIPEDRAKALRNSMYDNSIGTGHLLTMPGDVIDQEKIQEQILADKRMFKVDEILLDGWNAAGLMQKLSKEKMNVSEFRMVTANLSEPTKMLDALMRQGKIRHNGSPLLRWALGNVVCKEDAAANVFPRKTHEKLKIDPIISLLMALAPWLQDKSKDSIYNSAPMRHF